VLGLALGLAVSVVLVKVVNPQSFHWTMHMSVPPGSLLVLSHASYDLIPADAAARLVAEDYPGKDGFHPRTQAEVNAFFTGLELLGQPEPGNGSQPGVGLISQWRRWPEHGETPPGSAVSTFGGMGRKP